ncbi:MAG: response regulator [Patescibacteria group bacterium]|nr:response regulator [Patescibacteria group bacterium]
MNRVRIMLVDDDYDFRVCLAIDLKGYGCLVHQFENGRVALDAASDGSVEFDILVTDWKMPLRYGDELIEELREGGFTQPMILWSSNLPLPKCVDATLVLGKNVGLSGLTAAIRQCLQTP